MAEYNYMTAPLPCWEGPYQVRVLTKRDEILQAFHLRHLIFHEELKWVPNSKDRIESDLYDKKAIFLGAFNVENKLHAFIRLILHKDTFMIENEFSNLVRENYKIRKDYDTAEISRLCIAKEARNKKILSNFGMHSLSMLLYKGIYIWCKQNYVRYLYAVIEVKLYKIMLRGGFPCRLIGNPTIMPDKIKAVAVIFDWEEFKTLNISKKPEMLDWFSQYQSNRGSLHFQQPGL